MKNQFIAAAVAGWATLVLSSADLPVEAGDEVLITSARDGNAELYLVELGAMTAKNLTNNAAWDIYPSWSRDGKKIVFSSTRGRAQRVRDGRRRRKRHADDRIQGQVGVLRRVVAKGQGDPLQPA